MAGRPKTVRSEEFKLAICQAYERGQSIIYIAGYMGIAEKTCSAILKECGVILREAGLRRSAGS